MYMLHTSTCTCTLYAYNSQGQMNVNSVNSPTAKLVLEADDDGNPLIKVNANLIRELKPHQVEGEHCEPIHCLK